jgi:putative oxidoreductase
MKLALPRFLASPLARSTFAWLVLRLVLAGLVAAHGWARLISGGVPPFGEFLTSQGFPVGFYFAALVTAIEIVGSIFLLLGRFAALVCAVLALIYAMGIALVHAQEGWFVVGLGRNGSEYSVLLIVCLLLTGLQHVRSRDEN